MSLLIIIGYMIAFLIVGFFGAFGMIRWLWGSDIWTMGMAHMKGKEIVQYPTEDNTWEFKGVEGKDRKGNWIIEADDKTRKLKTKPGDANIEGGKVPMAIFFPGHAVSTAPGEGKVAELSDSTNDEEEYEIWGESINWNTVTRKLESVLSADHYASILASGMEAHKPLEAPGSGGMSTGDALKVGGAAMVVAVAIIALYIAYVMM